MLIRRVIVRPAEIFCSSKAKDAQRNPATSASDHTVGLKVYAAVRAVPVNGL